MDGTADQVFVFCDKYISSIFNEQTKLDCGYQTMTLTTTTTTLLALYLTYSIKKTKSFKNSRLVNTRHLENSLDRYKAQGTESTM